MTNLKMNLKLEDDSEKSKRVAKAKAKKKEALHEPTWEEVWQSIYNKKNSNSDLEKLKEVQLAIENGEIGTHVDSLKKFCKAHALRLHKVLVEQRKESIIRDMIANAPVNYHLITSQKQFLELSLLLSNESIIGLDTETNGLDYDTNYIVGISMTLPLADYHCYIPIRHENPDIQQLDAEYVFEQLKPFLEDEKLGKVLHNAKFDFHMFYREGIYVKGLVMDTMIAMKLLNENEPSYALKNLSTKYGAKFGFEDKSMTYEELFGSSGFQNTKLDIATVYACKDTHLCYEFYKWIDSKLEELPKIRKIYYEIELPNTIVAFDMEKNGFLIDLDFASTYTEKLKIEIEYLSQQLKEIFGNVNLNSPIQLAKVLYDDWKLEDKSGKRSVDADTIKYLAEENEQLKVLLKYRELNKLLTTYFEALPQKIWNRDGRLHGSFNQTGTSTGRYSSNNPNLQNIPPEARPMVIAPEGKVLIGKDLSQIEPRMLAYMSGDKDFQSPYLNKIDLYSTLASKVFNLPIEKCGDGTKYRKMLKTGLLATMYGTSTYTLSKQLGISVEEAEQFIQDFLSNYPITRDYMQSIKDFVDKNGYVETYLGRKRRFNGHKQNALKYRIAVKKIKDKVGELPSSIWDNKKIPYAVKQEYWESSKPYSKVSRQAVNAVIQGSSADYLKIVMVRINSYLKSLGEDYKLVATIHDEILMEVPESISAEVIAELDRIMTSVEWFDFPIKTDTVAMYSWGKEIPINKWLSERRLF